MFLSFILNTRRFALINSCGYDQWLFWTQNKVFWSLKTKNMYSVNTKNNSIKRSESISKYMIPLLFCVIQNLLIFLFFILPSRHSILFCRHLWTHMNVRMLSNVYILYAYIVDIKLFNTVKVKMIFSIWFKKIMHILCFWRILLKQVSKCF